LFEEILQFVKEEYHNLKKTDLSNYSAKVEKAVRGTLTSNKVFEQTNNKKWKIRDKAFADKILQVIKEKISTKEKYKENKKANTNNKSGEYVKIGLRKKYRRRYETYHKISG